MLVSLLRCHAWTYICLKYHWHVHASQVVDVAPSLHKNCTLSLPMSEMKSQLVISFSMRGPPPLSASWAA
jgi:hypothetical protein